MDNIPSVGSQLFEKGWLQGAYIACSDVSEKVRDACWASNESLANNLNNQLIGSKNVLILLSQACDIVAPCDMEPTLEFVIARRLKKNSKPFFQNLNAYSTRFLELQLNDKWYKAKASKILHIPKQMLFEDLETLGVQPSCLNAQDIEILARWRANRYMRVALPNKFIEKIKPLLVNGVFDQGLEHAGGLYLQLEPFSESTQYIVRLFALHRRGSPIETFDYLFNKMELILEEMNKMEGITCPFVEEENSLLFENVMPAMRRNEVSIELRDHFVRWNFDSISLKANDSIGIDES